MFSCQPLHAHIRHSRDGYSVARRIVFAVTCVLLLVYGAEELMTAPTHAPLSQTTALWMTTADVQALFDEETAPQPAPTASIHRTAVPAPVSHSATARPVPCLHGPLLPAWSPSCLVETDASHR